MAKMCQDKRKCREKICGIYKITNTLNGKCYIGQSVDIYKRWVKHKSNCVQNQQRNKCLYRAFRKYGIDNFTFEILQKCKKEKLDEREEYWIKKYDSFKNGYNMNSGGHSHCGSWSKYKHKHLREYRRWQKDYNVQDLDSRPNIVKTFQIMKHTMLPYPDDEIDAMEYIDNQFITEIDGYDTMLFDFADGYDNFEQWAECNLI